MDLPSHTNKLPSTHHRKSTKKLVIDLESPPVHSQTSRKLTRHELRSGILSGPRREKYRAGSADLGFIKLNGGGIGYPKEKRGVLVFEPEGFSSLNIHVLARLTPDFLAHVQYVLEKCET
jgi:hypothetical protein